ncbi:MAG: hypothetical protein ACREUZ_09000, partial [Burkholderiales bacterium]
MTMPLYESGYPTGEDDDSLERGAGADADVSLVEGTDNPRMEYVSRVPRPPLDGLIDDLYYLEGAPPYALLTLPPAPSALLIVNLGAPFRI